LYIPNWIWRYFTEVHYHWDPIPVVAGIIQTVLYTDFFYIYYTKYVSLLRMKSTYKISADESTGCSRARSSTCPYRVVAFHLSPAILSYTRNSRLAGCYHRPCA
jgi:hypothetical protein